MRSDAPNPQFDNSDILSPQQALINMTDRVMAELAERGVKTDDDLLRVKEGKEAVKIPYNFTGTQIRDCYQRVKRLLSIKEAGAPHCPTIREEFEVAITTAYRNKSYHVFYIESMFRAFMSNHTIDIDVSAIAYEARLANAATKKDYHTAMLVAFDNVLRFHPLYVAYLYGASADYERENTLIAETTSYMAWLFTKG